MAPTADEKKEAIKDLRYERECHYTMFCVLKDYVNAWSASTALVRPTVHRLMSVRDDLLSNKASQKAVHVAIFKLCEGSEFSEKHEAKFDLIYKELDDALDKVLEMIETLKAANPVVPVPAKLESLKIPTFNGNFEDWQAFHDMFQSMVHLRVGLSGAEKLTYLQSALTGPAASAIASYEPTDANYSEAWKHLTTRFNVKREIIFAHLKTFEDFKPRHSDPDFGLRALADALNKCIRSLKVQTMPVDKWDVILIYLALKKMDPDSKKQWSLDLKVDIPVMKDFQEFLETRARALTTSQPKGSSGSTKPNSSTSKASSSNHAAATQSHTQSNSNARCGICSGNHTPYKCTDYKSLSTNEKWTTVKQKKLCTNCLSSDHQNSNCTSKYSCMKCSKRHHTSLHSDPSATAQQSSTPAVSSSHCARKVPEKVVLLGTLLVNVVDSRGQTQQCRVFVDNGSECHFISEHCLTRLGLKRRKAHVPITAIGHKGPTCKGEVALTIESQTQPFSLNISALVLPRFSGLIPRTNCQSNWSHLEGLPLSDPKFHSAQYTDILLGAAKSGHIMLPQIITDPSNSEAPVAINTRFGWMINGEAPVASSSATNARHAVHHAAFGNQAHDLNSALSKFWEQEEPEPTLHPMSSSDVDCEEHFLSTHSLNSDGTYTVELPFKHEAPQLGKSRDAAVRRFLKVEQRLSRQPQVKQEYVKSIQEFQKLGYLEPVPAEDLEKPPASTFYMPHHEVVKESSSTTKVRIVFDASAKSSSGVSLNDILCTGPKLQVDLFPLMLRFMTYPIAMSADIWKFYPQTSVHPNHRDFQRLVWRENPQQPLQDLRMRQVTFGVSPAPFLAIRSLHELANKYKDSHPWASQVIKEEFLVDNLLSGGPDVQSTLELKAQLLQVMEHGGLKLLKFTSNSKALLDSIPPELRDPSSFLPIDEGEFVKTIGILWNPHSDTFRIQINVPEVPVMTTKRTVLSVIARTFDPLGWLSPVTITPKILIQDLWKAKLGWDEPLPLHFHQQWRSYCEELPTLQSFQLHRNAFAAPDPSSTQVSHQLHGFSDGSNLAHAACVYIRSEDSEGRVAVRLLTAKTRVNPILKPTTPRSELCGAVLLTSLISTVRKSVKIEFKSIHCWTDSTVVLGRLSPDKKLPIYELNRIRKILATLPAPHWHHVRGEENPADAPSRGIPPTQLINHPLWTQGPEFLLSHIPDLQSPVSSSAAAVTNTPVSDLIHNCSNYKQIQMRMGYVNRFLHNTQARKEERRTGKLSVLELNQALTTILKIVQNEAFHEEIANCQQKVTPKSKIKFLAPFLDESGILRVGGRLQHAPIGYTQKHPALLPKSHHFVDVMARHFHQTHLHAGPTLLLSLIREQFWPVRGSDLVKRIVKSCVTCHRVRASTSTQQMGQLPPSRVNPAPPFTNSGVDYAGPFQLALRTGRKPPIVKSYVAVFVCMATKATHLELVSDLSTASFIAALNRFISRRGLPSDIYSDEGTNFVGAKSELEELLSLITSSSHHAAVRDSLTPRGINFHTNPPSAPHHGGLWEAAVKSMKGHLKRVTAFRHLTVEEFSTLLCQVEAMLNSRPLTPMSEDPNDYSVLTPGHFLISRPLVALPHPDLAHLPLNRLDRWQTVEYLNQQIWNTWRRDYLNLLQSRPKWYAPLPDIQPGTMVLIVDKDSSLGPQQWKLGRVIDVFPGPDGKTRVCDVRTNVTSRNPTGSVLRRPIVKLSPLPIY